MLGLVEAFRNLPPAYTVFGLFSVLVAAFLCRCIYNRYFHPLAKFPGPFLASISDLNNALQYFSGQEHLVDWEMHKKYGPIVRVAPGILLFNDPELLPELYHRRADKSQYYTADPVFGPNAYPPTQFVHEHAAHTLARKRISAPFTKSAVKALEPTIVARIEEWIGKLREISERGEAVHFSDWSTFLAWDVISELCFGEPFGFISKEQDVDGMAHALEATMLPGGVVLRLPWLLKTMKFIGLLKWIVPNTKDKTGVGRAMAFRDNLLEKRMQDTQKHDDILAHLLETQPPMSYAQLQSEVLVLMLAGSDTTSGTIRALLIHLLEDRRVLDKLMETDFSGSKPVGVQEKSPYFEAVLKESMRHAHAASTMFPRLVRPGGITLKDGTFIPGGTEINMNSYCVNRDTGIFGADADKFRPERWLESEEKTMLMDKYSMTWGYGSRTCAGRPVAEMELFYATRRLFEEFEISFKDPSKPVRVENRVVMVHYDMWLNLKKRAPKP